MSYRNFPDVTEALAKSWAENALATDRWRLLEKVSARLGQVDTESSPFVAQSGPMLAIAKPSGTKSRAAIEKIVSDLAYHFGLPVSPVILWKNPDVQGDDKYMSLTAWAFEPVFTWDQAHLNLSDIEKSQVIKALSAIRPFEIWISAHDRGGKHTLVDVEVADTTVRIALIDYAHSLTHTWDRDGHPDADISRSFLPQGDAWDTATAEEVVEKIEKFDEGVIKAMVTRIPGSFLSTVKSDIIIQNLLGRRQSLRKILQI